MTKVWLLMGGEGLQRQQSLRSGLHACLMLQDNSELQVCVCSPVDASVTCWMLWLWLLLCLWLLYCLLQEVNAVIAMLGMNP